MTEYTFEDDIFCGVNMPETDNSDEMNELEKKYAVVIEAPDEVKKGEPFEVTVKFGE